MNNPVNNIAKTLGLDQQSKMTSRLKLYLLWGGIALIIVLLVWFWIGRQSAGQVEYQTQAVKRGSLTVTVAASGTLQPTNQVDVGSEISGTIKTVEVDYNDQVTRGQVLAKIDTAKLEAQVKETAASLDAARAHVLQTQATVNEAKAKLARLAQVQEASDGKVPSKTEMDTAKANLDRARADEANSRAAVVQAEATLEAQRTDLTKAVIRSPVKGVVLNRAAEPGQTVAATFQTPVLFTLAEDLTRMELHVDVDEADVGKMREAQTATFTVDAYPDRSFPAHITQVRFGSKTVAGVVTYETVLKVDNTGLLLRPGMTGTANITVQQVRDALLVPNTALRFTPPQGASKPAGDGGLVSNLMPRPPSSASKPVDSAEDKQPHVWVLHEGNLKKVALKTGMTDGVMTEIREGKLEPDMTVVVDVIEANK
ncbi:MAG: efflux RND transporter periplasmic adaptor subunit [Desulfurivibrionaceae bacterium]|jgi:HlyD family secretion protein